MKSKLSWVPFIPLCLLACFCKAAQYLFPEGTVLGLSNLILDYCFIGMVVLIFLFSALFCLVDKRISTYYLTHRNIPAGILGILLALAFAADGAMAMFNMFGVGKPDALKVIEAVLLLLSAIVFIVLGLTHSFRGSEGKGFSAFNVLPAILCAIRMIICFVGFTTISIRLADVPELICYIFATMFFFNYAVALSLTKAKNAVKSCFIFGFPAAAATLSYGAVKLIFNFDSQDLFANVGAVQMVLMGLYILAFLIELTAFVKDKDSVKIIDPDDEDDDDMDASAQKTVDSFVVPPERDDDDEPESAYLTTADTKDYLYRESERKDNTPVMKRDPKDIDTYITEITEEKPETSDRPRDYTSRLDEIDKLILEISEQDNQ